MTPKLTKILINTLAIISIIAGLFGMLLCLPFLFSAKLEDLVGAGFPFVGGCILFSSGLLTLGLFNKQMYK